VLLPGPNDCSCSLPDGKSTPETSPLVVVVDEGGASVHRLKARAVKTGDLVGTPSGISQDCVDSLVHGGEICWPPTPGIIGGIRPQHREVGVHLRDHVFGDSPADLIFGGGDQVDAVVPWVEREGPGNFVHQPGLSGEVDQSAPPTEHRSAVAER
jgi:hypothetical protein